MFVGIISFLIVFYCFKLFFYVIFGLMRIIFAIILSPFTILSNGLTKVNGTHSHNNGLFHTKSTTKYEPTNHSNVIEDDWPYEFELYDIADCDIDDL